jgi:hypothetical protein
LVRRLTDICASRLLPEPPVGSDSPLTVQPTSQ